MRLALLHALAALALAASTIPAQAAAADDAGRSRRPNIVLIMADDVGVECFGCYDGADGYATPRIDALAADGLRFTSCHSQPLCTPSRVALMTGMSNARNYRAFSVLPPGSRTFAHELRDAGYATVVVGKWQLLAASHYREPIRGSGTHPRDAGFDAWTLWQVDRLGKRYWNPTLTIGPGADGSDRVTVGPADAYGPELFRDALIAWLKERASERDEDRPFLAYWPMALPHNPFLPTPGDDAPPDEKAPKHFASMVATLDRLVGDVADALAELGLAENTLLLFTSDNGTNRKIRSHFADGRIVRGGKSKTTDFGTHVPLVAHWPGTIEAGRTCDDLIGFVDVYSTLATLAGIELADDHAARLDGVSFAPQLHGDTGTPRETLYCWYHPRPLTRAKSSPVRFVRDHRYKLYGSGELFDTVADPDETTPLDATTDDASPLAEARVRLERALAAAPNR